MKYEFENLEVSFDGTQEQADALKERAEALGYDLSRLKHKDKSKYLFLYMNKLCSFYTESYKKEETRTESFADFMSRTAQYLQPKPYPCQAHDDQTHIVEIDGEKWRVELIEKVIEPLNAWQWFSLHDVNGGTADWMQAYSDYRIEFYKKHGI